MSEIRSITKRLRHQEWAEQINDRIQSGESIPDWCGRHGIGIEAYKYRLRVVRKEAIAASPAAFAELTEPQRPRPITYGSSAAPFEEVPGFISIEINGAVIRFGPGTSESLISSAVRAVHDA